MKKSLPLFVAFLMLSGLLASKTSAQVQNLSKWSIKDIMADDFIGFSPGNIQWSQDSKNLFFYWNPGDAKSDSAYKITPTNLSPVRVDPKEFASARPERGIFTKDKKYKLQQSAKGIELIHLKKSDTLLIYSTTQRTGSPAFSFDESMVLFSIERNLYSWNRTTGAFAQLTNFVEEEEKKDRPQREALTPQDEWLKAQQEELFPKVARGGGRNSFFRGGNFSSGMGGMPGSPAKPLYLNGFSVRNVQLSPDNRYVTYLLSKSADQEAQNTQMPDYVTLSGYTEIRDTRSKVGSLPGEMKMGIYDLQSQKVYELDLSGLPGIFDAPAYYSDYGREPLYEKPKAVNLIGPQWSDDGKFGVMSALSFDNKDRWIFLVDLEKGSTRVLDHQHDEAWIGGPGIGYGGVGWMPDNTRIWFQSEESGYSHLYTVNVVSGEKKALTSGNFEVYRPYFSADKKSWYFTSNEVHPGEQHIYRMPLNGGERTRLTHMPGSHQMTLSPDEKYMAILYSFANRPPELYFQANKPDSDPVQITDGRSEKFRSYNWREPEFISFEAEDGTTVYARLYQPEKQVANKAAVIFVHGAGYLQNAHKWWSTYYKEFMFHNILADNGYTVLDIDYRGSSGYGRDCRTGIYRWMGGKDLSDHVDGAKLLIKDYGIDPGKIGIYGGSYGGFITLMAMFNAADVFSAGAALRSVTDWAHYNHGYTANILNTPVEDSIAYARSSPIYFAEGLKGNLLMCHGMLDDNVHFQDIVRLSQRLIDLGKDNWELAVYPLQRHSFTDPDAWTDEYKRIFKLFQTTIGAN